MRVVVKSGLGCGTVFVLVLMIGMVGSCFGVGQKPRETPQKTQQEQPRDETPLVTEETRYSVTRADVRRGVMGDTVALDGGSERYADFYAIAQPDGSFSFDINGVAYNTKVTKGEQVNHIYSGQEQKVTQLLLDGKTTATVGTVGVEAFCVDDVILVDLSAREDGQYTQYTFYLMKAIS